MHILTAATAPAETACDLLVIGVAKDSLAETLTSSLGDFGGALADAAGQDEFKGATATAQTYATFGRIAASRVLLVGLGERGVDDIRRAAGKAGFAARSAGAQAVALHFGDLDGDATAAVVEGFGVGNYRFDRYQAEDKRKSPATGLTLLGATDDGSRAAALATLAGQLRARDLVNEPAAVIYPETLADNARELAGDQVSVTIWDADRIRAERMAGITAVGQGSARPPRFIHIKYTPAGEVRRKVALVGKGVTFDSGGLSLKPSAGMQTMRCDMAGAAAVIGVLDAIARLAPEGVEVHGIVGAAENMTSGAAYKLGDILTMRNGKTVEIHNTDAEGRLVLADCLVYASELGVDAIIDIATLTGACLVALGGDYSGLFTKDDALASALLANADASGEGLWRLPMPDAYKEKLKSQWASLKNVGGREGGAITAALFLSEFVEGAEWAHVDIAGPSFYDKNTRHFAAGGTGAMVPTLTRWALGS